MAGRNVRLHEVTDWLPPITTTAKLEYKKCKQGVCRKQNVSYYARGYATRFARSTGDAVPFAHLLTYFAVSYISGSGRYCRSHIVVRFANWRRAICNGNSEKEQQGETEQEKRTTKGLHHL